MDEPTAALGVAQTGQVLDLMRQVRDSGIPVVFISHNIHHACAVADRFTLLNRGKSKGTFRKDEISRDEVLHIMAGGEDLQHVQAEIVTADSRRPRSMAASQQF